MPLRYTVPMQLADMFVPFAFSAVSGSVLLATNFLPFVQKWMFPLQALVFVAVYSLLSFLFLPRSVREMSAAVLPTARRKLHEGGLIVRVLTHVAGKYGEASQTERKC